MSNQILISSGAKLRDLDDVIIGTDGVLSSLAFNVANGVPKLDENGKILVSQLPNSVMEFKGVWDAATNTPTLANGTGNAGDVYLCNVAGTVDFGAGPIAFAVGDYAVYTGTVWARSSGATGTVTSVGLSRSGDALTVTGSPITTSGTINIGFAGTNLQYINGAGNLVTFPTIATEAQRLITEVYNETGATLAKGTIVYINGGHGNLPTVTKAIATGDATSAQTYGIVQNDIGNMNNGFVVVIGSLTDLDTQVYPEGTQLYLSGTTAGAWTSTKPYAPVHLVYVAIVTRSHPTQGVVEVSIQNGYEMDELHNVSAQNPSNNDILQYKTATNLWTKVAGTTTNIAEGSNQYFTDARARLAISLTTTGSTGAATYDNTTGVLNIPNYVDQYVGTVTSVGLSAPTGFSVTGSPVTTTGTLALAFASGYSLPTNVKQSNWDDAYTWVAAFPTQTGNAGKFLTTDGSTLSWAANPLGTVTSVAMTVPTGLSVAGSPITTSGTLAVTFAAGYSIPTTAKQTEWDTAYTNRITSATSPLSITSNVISISLANSTTNGYLSSTDWNTFNGKQNALTNPVTGTGTINTVPKFTAASTIASSNIYINGNFVGINQSSPASPYALDIHAANSTYNLRLFQPLTATDTYNNIYITGNQTTVAAYFGIGGATTGNTSFRDVAVIGTQSAHPLVFNTSDTNQMRLFANGNLLVGTGTTDAGFKLDVSGSGRFAGGVRLNVDNSSLSLNRTATNKYIGIQYYTNSTEYWFVGLRETLTNNYIIYSPTSNTDILTLNPTTNAATFANSIGIGTTTLSGNLSISHSAFSNAGTKSYTADNVGGISAYVSSQDPYRGYLDIYSTRSGDGNTLGGSIIRFLTSTTSTTINAIERMVINQVGNVAIGNSSPLQGLNRTLTVEGTGIFQTSAVGGNYNENLRLNRAGNGYSALAMGGAYNTTSGTGVGQWTLAATPASLSYRFDIDYNGSTKFVLTTSGELLLNTTSGVSGGGTLQVNGDVNINGNFKINGTIIGGGGGSGVTGSGTANYITKWTGASTLSNSVMYDNGSGIGIGTTTIGGYILALNRNASAAAVMSIQNASTTGYSGAHLLDSAGTLVAHWGYGNTGVGSPLTDSVYFGSIGAKPVVITVADAERFRWQTNGDISFNGGSGSTQVATATPKNFRFNNDYSTGYTDASLKIYLFNSGSTLQGFTSGPAYDIQYHTSGSDSGRHAFYVGNVESMRINKTNVIIGIGASDGYTLQVKGSASFSYGYLTVYRGSSGAGDILIGNTGSTFYIGGNTQVVGSVSASSGFFDTSDARLKTLVEDNYLLSSIANVKAKLYKKEGRMELGYYAQDLENILPSAVKEGVDGFLSLSYAQVHTAKIAVIEDEVSMLKNRVSELEKQLNLN